MRYSIVGAGNGGRLWARAILAHGSEIAGVCDTDENRLIDSPWPAFLSVEALLARDESDFIVLATPVATHYALARMLLREGRNVIVEKPVSYEPSHLHELLALARQNGARLVCAHHAAYAVDVDWFLQNRASVESDLGALVGFSCDFFDPYVKDGALISDAKSLHGSYLDSAVNALSVLQRVIGLDGLLPLTDPRQFMKEDNLHAEVHYRRDGIEGVICTDWRMGVNRKTTELRYADGTVLLNHSAQTVERRSAGRLTVTDCNPLGRERLLNQYVAMLEAIENGSAESENWEELYGLLLWR